MWDLGAEYSLHRRYLHSLPIITYEWVLTILTILFLTHILIEKYLIKHFHIDRLRSDTSLNSLEYSPFYHLAIVILILGEIDWNIFDLSLWTLIYIGTSIIRRAIFNIKTQRQSLLNSFSYDANLINILYSAKLIGIFIFLIGIILFVTFQLIFTGISMKVTSLLVFPLLILAVDGLFLFLSSAASQKDLLCYFNQNINQILPTYKLQLVQKITGNSIRIWHYYNILRLFIRALLLKMGIFQYMWIFSVVNACLAAVKTLYTSMSKYRNYNKLMVKFDKLFRKTTSAPDQNCTICLTQLLNCRQLASCGHHFHYRCLFQWMQTKMECPICRVPIQLH